MYIILLGAPGAGKGTQAKLLARKLGLAHVASGDLFREAVERGTPLGQVAKSYMDRGLLVPDDIVVRLILDRLAEPDAARGAILDGFPRTLEQARALDEALAAQGKQIDRVVLLYVPLGELVRRLSSRRVCRNCQRPYTEEEASALGQRCKVCGGELYQRPDDRAEVVRQRLETFRVRTSPLIEYYATQGKLAEVVNGHQEVEAVTRDILRALGVEN